MVDGELGEVLQKYAQQAFNKLGEYANDPALCFRVSLNAVPDVTASIELYTPQSGNSLAAQELQRPFWAYLYRILGSHWFDALFVSGTVLMPIANSFLQLSAGRGAGRVAGRQQAFRAITAGGDKMVYSGPNTLVRKANVLYKEATKFTVNCSLEAVFPNVRFKKDTVPKRLAKVAPLLAKLNRKHYMGRSLLDKMCPAVEGSFVPLRQVADLLYAHVRAIVPAALMEGNEAAVRASIRKWVFLRRFNSLSVAELAQGFKTSMPWLALGGGKSEALARQSVLYQFIYWLFVHVIEPLATFHFYATEASHDPGGVFFYRWDVWREVEREALENFKQTLEPAEPIPSLEPTESIPSLTPGRARVVPKKTGARVIVNLRSFTEILHGIGQAANQMAAATPGLLASHHDALARLTEFRRQHPLSRFFVVKIDMDGCYDSVDIDKMRDILHSRLNNRNFVSRIFSLPSRNRRSRQLYFLADTSAQLARILPRTLRSAQLIETADPKVVTSEDILDFFEYSLTMVPIKIGTETYVKKQGLPQGLAVSSGLCNLLYGDLVKNELRHLYERQDSLLLRYVDDFLFVSTDEPSAAEFLRRALAGFPEYGARIKQEKLQTNLVGPLNQASVQHVTFVGYQIDCKTLQGQPLRSKRVNVPAMTRIQVETKLRHDFMIRSNAFAGYRRWGTRVPLEMADNMALLLGHELAMRMNGYGNLHRRHSDKTARRILLWISRRYQRSNGEQMGRFMRKAIAAWSRHQHAYPPSNTSP